MTKNCVITIALIYSLQMALDWFTHLKLKPPTGQHDNSFLTVGMHETQSLLAIHFTALVQNSLWNDVCTHTLSVTVVHIQPVICVEEQHRSGLFVVPPGYETNNAKTCDFSASECNWFSC